MLKTPAPFPQVGSYALYEGDGQTHLVRIIGKDPGGDVTLSFPRQRFGASGNKTVPLAELIDGTPLSDAERAEYNALERTVPAAPSRSPKVRAQQRLYAELRDRDINSATLANLLALSQRARAA